LFTGACASDASNVLVVARFGEAATRIGGTWAQSNTPTGRFLLGCTFVGTDAWAVGGDAVEHYVTGTWTDITTFPTKHNLTDVVVTTPSGFAIVVSTTGGLVITGDGATWQEEATPTGFDLNKLTVLPSGVVYAAGDGGVILRRQ